MNPPFSFDLQLASPRGFCAGVDRAITIVERALELYGAPIYVRHEIVHNPHVVRRLKAKGVIFVEEIDETIPQNSYVIFSAHGVSPFVEERAKELNLNVLNATCPLVTKVHVEAKRYAKKGFSILLIGHADHVEVQGTLGHAVGQIQVVETVEDIPKVKVADESKVAYLTQTTLSLDDTAEIIAGLKKRFPQIVGPAKDDICYATQNRQNAVKAMAKRVDLVLVVGAPNSSNTLRLVEVAKAKGVSSRRIESAEELEHDWFIGVKTIGITAGASAPEDVVQGIVKKLQEISPSSALEEFSLVDENVTFGLPAELKIPTVSQEQASS